MDRPRRRVPASRPARRPPPRSRQPPPDQRRGARRTRAEGHHDGRGPAGRSRTGGAAWIGHRGRVSRMV